MGTKDTTPGPNYADVQSVLTTQSRWSQRDRNTYCLAGFLLAIHAALLAWNAYIHSPTLNEPAHLVAGISNWQQGRFHIYKANTPLTRMVAALPVLLVGAETDWRRDSTAPGARSEFNVGADFIAANGERSLWLITLARWTCIPFSLLGGYVCFRWAGQLYGTVAGLLPLSLWCFCPNILGHGSLITSDVTATALGILACYSFWQWLRQPTWKQVVLSGALLGLAELAKTTLIILVPLWYVMWAIYRWPSRATMWHRDWGREFAMLAVRMLIAMYVINLGYGFEGFGRRLGDFRFVSATFGSEDGGDKAPPGGGNRFASSGLGAIPVPFPENYLLGIDVQRKDFENYYHPSYLRGEFRMKGWWYYYLYAVSIKVPLGTWILIAAAGTRRLWANPKSETQFASSADEADTLTPDKTRDHLEIRHMRWQDEFILLFPAAVIFVVVSSQTGFSEHMRYVLPTFPAVFVWAGRIVPALWNKHWVYSSVPAVALGWSIFSSLSVYPHSLSYFNELVGGPIGGPQHLIYSSVDWGQDLLLLKKWLQEHPEATPLNLTYFGFFEPKNVGIEYQVPRELIARDQVPVPIDRIPPGWYAISVNFVQGLPFGIYLGNNRKSSLARHALAQFHTLEPVARVGYSIYIYYIPPKSQADDASSQ